jgi:hypothetical protein
MPQRRAGGQLPSKKEKALQLKKLWDASNLGNLEDIIEVGVT